MLLRTIDGKMVEGTITVEHSSTSYGTPVLVVEGQAYKPEEACFFLQAATVKEHDMLIRGGYELGPWISRRAA